MTLSGIVKSGKEARRLITDKAVRLEGKLISDITEKFENTDFKSSKQISIGKKKHVNIIIN